MMREAGRVFATIYIYRSKAAQAGVSSVRHRREAGDGVNVLPFVVPREMR